MIQAGLNSMEELEQLEAREKEARELEISRLLAQPSDDHPGVGSEYSWGEFEISGDNPLEVPGS